LPGKSGIGGGIVTVAPGKGGLGAFALLDEAGNSVRGRFTAAFLSRRLGLDISAQQAPNDETRRDHLLAALALAAAPSATVAQERALAGRYAPVVPVVALAGSRPPGDPYLPIDVRARRSPLSPAFRGTRPVSSRPTLDLSGSKEPLLTSTATFPLWTSVGTSRYWPSDIIRGRTKSDRPSAPRFRSLSCTAGAPTHAGRTAHDRRFQHDGFSAGTCVFC
jgi:hypothetical protein